MRTIFTSFVLICALLAFSGGAAEETAPAPTPDPAPAKPAVASDRLDLGGGLSMELVSIPSGSFQMGATEKLPESPWVGLGLLLGATGIIISLVVVVIARAMINHERPRFSLLVLLGGTLAFGVGMVGLLRWRKSNSDRSELTALPNERPVHAVSITRPFLMGKFCVSQQQFDAVMRINYSFFKAPDHPVEQISWEDAAAFCSRVSKASGRTVRLPTEAEWEYACRAGSRTLYSGTDNPQELGKLAWFGANSKNTTHSADDSVKNIKPNAWGLYDMHGNVMQWCQDWFDEGYYAISPVPDPTGPMTGMFRVVRGSSWLDTESRCRASTRNAFRPDKRSYCVGFRVVVAQ